MKSGGSVRSQGPEVAASQRLYDIKGRLIKVLEPDQDGHPVLETDYTYDDFGNIVTIVQHGKSGDVPRIRRFTYNQHSSLLSATSPEGGTVKYSYDSQDYLVSTTDSRDITTTYSRDILGRLTGMQYSDGTPSIVYQYADDSSNRISSSYLDTPEGHKAERNYHYNTDGHPDLITQRGKENYTIRLGYDAAGHVDQITYPDGRVIRQVWNQTGTLGSLLAQEGVTYFTRPSYTSSGALQSALLGNGVTIYSSYDSKGHLSMLTAAQGNQRILDKRYYYSDFGSISSIIDALNPDSSLSFGYDTLHRISNATQAGKDLTQSFEYDAFGNLKQEGSFPSPQAYDANNRVESADVAYDDSGEVTFDGVHRYQYDAAGKIIDVDNGAIQYMYSADGYRVQKQVYGVVTEEVWLGDELLAERESDGSWVDYLYANGQRVAKVHGVDVSYYVSDPLGMTRMELSDNGTVLAQVELAPFGQVFAKNPQTTKQTVPFTGGEERDMETGLDSYQFRSYSPVLGRWMSPDPSGEHYANLRNPQSLNLYSYVLNDPLKYIDGNGLDVCSDGTVADVCVTPGDCGEDDNTVGCWGSSEPIACSPPISCVAPPPPPPSAEEIAAQHAEANMQKYTNLHAILLSGDSAANMRITVSCGTDNHSCTYILTGAAQGHGYYIYEHQTMQGITGTTPVGPYDYQSGDPTANQFNDQLGTAVGFVMDTYRFFTISTSSTFDPSNQTPIMINELGGTSGFEHIYCSGGPVYINGSPSNLH